MGSIRSISPYRLFHYMLINKSEEPLSVRQNQGFTLIELLLVVVVISILAGIIAPNLLGNNARRMSDDAERIMLLINMAQQEAIISSTIWKVTLDPVLREYSFLKQSNDDFELINKSPFSGTNKIIGVNWQALIINAENTEEASALYLFPTGEHDSFSLKLGSDDMHYTVMMGPTGPATLE